MLQDRGETVEGGGREERGVVVVLRGDASWEHPDRLAEPLDIVAQSQLLVDHQDLQSHLLVDHQD